MPLIESSGYRSRGLLKSGHLQTVLPTLLRAVPEVRYQRTRLTLRDKDFVDLDCSSVTSDRVAVLCHGLEGSTDTHYMRGMTRALNRAGWDVVGFNFRGCSGEPNLQPRFYHSGATDDLAEVVDAVTSRRALTHLALVGFSLGGNLVLKYLGEARGDYPPSLAAAVAISVPCDLGECATRLGALQNQVYARRFLRHLKNKVRDKARHLPGLIDLTPLPTIHSIEAFDEHYTAPLNGFANARDYWMRCSSRYFLDRLASPVLLLSAANDPLLTPACYPVDVARRSDRLTLEIPPHGGHVGFMQHPTDGRYWHEQRAVDFLARHS
ncbi:MAG: alpha/beta fold hydrolase [Pseudomonadota bacterium]|nr:alpha/beta fold hydrolase [Pseudomonadota bacterium]